MEKNVKKSMCLTESFCWVADTNTANQLHFNTLKSDASRALLLGWPVQTLPSGSLPGSHSRPSSGSPEGAG